MNRLPSITARVLREELEAEFPDASVFLLDRTYSPVDEDFRERWMQRFDAEIKAASRGVWDPMFDCEDYVELAKVEAKKLHMQARLQGYFGGQGVAVGMLCFHQEGDISRGHAVCLIRQPSGWIAWDPVENANLSLSKLERESAFLIQL